MATANEFTFGVEIECYIPREAAPRRGYRHRGVQIPDHPIGWNAQEDGSLGTHHGYVSCEIVSPVLRGADGLRDLKRACEWLNAAGAMVDRRCGLHVHVGVVKGGAVGQKNLKAIMTAVANLEKAIYAATGTKSRERGSYCAPVSTCTLAKAGRLGMVDRYRILNVNTNKPTVEFRAFAGTTNFTKIASYVRLAVGVVQKSLDLLRLPPWTPAPIKPGKAYDRGGEGQSHLNRLMYWMGWTRGKEPRTFGDVGAGEDGLPSLDDSKAELARLAKKYDGVAPPAAALAAG